MHDASLHWVNFTVIWDSTIKICYSANVFIKLKVPKRALRDAFESGGDADQVALKLRSEGVVFF